MEKHFAWSIDLLAALFVLAVPAAIGWYFSEFWMGLAIAACGLLLFTYWQLNLLKVRLWHNKHAISPLHIGLWREIYLALRHIKQQQRNKRKQLGNIISTYKTGSEALPDAMVVINQQHEIIWCNRLARIELGINWPEKNGLQIEELIKDKQFAHFLAAKRFDSPLELPAPSNSHKVLEFRLVPFVDQGLMLLIRDVTRLSQIEKMRKDFVANVSHELRTPLTVISGYLEMLPEAADLPPLMLNKAIGEMRNQSQRMQNLVEELLQLSRIEASNERVFDKLVNVPQMLWQIQTEAQTLNREKQHKLFFDIAPNLQVYGIDTELRSAFSNLIFNAIHYTPDKGVIEVKWQLNQDCARFSVKDNGDGIAPQDISRITERFYRVDKARSRKTGGSGLGLSIVKHVLTHHNSSLKISSALGVGSDFSCEFSPELTHLSKK